MYEQKRSYHILKRQQDAGLQKQSDPSEKTVFLIRQNISTML